MLVIIPEAEFEAMLDAAEETEHGGATMGSAIWYLYLQGTCLDDSRAAKQLFYADSRKAIEIAAEGCFIIT